MSGLPVVVRRATVGDARAIARVHVRSWREAYAGVFSPYLLERLSVEGRTRRWRQLLESGRETWVAEREETVVGWASAGDGRDDGSPAPRELEGIYVLQSDYGSGAGQALLDAALGASAASLWVLADNPRAQAFYRRNGFTPDGTAKVQSFSGEPVTEIRMTRPAQS